MRSEREPEQADARNNVTSYTLDARDSVTLEAYPNGSFVTHTYDARYFETATGDASGFHRRTPDALNREQASRWDTSAIAPNRALTYSFDPAGNRLSTAEPGGTFTTFVYDSQNRLTGILNPYHERTTISYDALDRELVKTLANGMTVSHLYDAAGRELVIANVSAAGVALAVYTGTYDAAGNRLTSQELDGTRVTYGYDPAYQLVNEQRSGANHYNTTYQYDSAGNRTLKSDSGALTTYSYNQASELTQVTAPPGQPTTMISWDASGNLAVESSSGGSTTYSWDFENRLTNVVYADGTRETYAYDSVGLRQRKDTSSGSVVFLWDQMNLLQELSTAGALLAEYTEYAGWWGGLSAQRRSGTSSFPGLDLQASARVLVSAGGAITDSYSFKAFGEELAVSGSTTNPHRYVGATGYYRDTPARLCAPLRSLAVPVARWASRPAPYPTGGSGNAYGYLANCPTYGVDPSGLVSAYTTGSRPDPRGFWACWSVMCGLPGHDDPDILKLECQSCKQRFHVNVDCNGAAFQHCAPLPPPGPHPGGGGGAPGGGGGGSPILLPTGGCIVERLTCVDQCITASAGRIGVYISAPGLRTICTRLCSKLSSFTCENLAQLCDGLGAKAIKSPDWWYCDALLTYVCPEVTEAPIGLD